MTSRSSTFKPGHLFLHLHVHRSLMLADHFELIEQVLRVGHIFWEILILIVKKKVGLELNSCPSLTSLKNM